MVRRKPGDYDDQESCEWLRRVAREKAMEELEKSSAPMLIDARVAEAGKTLPAPEESRRSA